MLEKELEKKLIEQLIKQGYVYRDDIKNISDLENNFKKHIENINNLTFSDNEFDNILNKIITNDVFEASSTIRGMFNVLLDNEEKENIFFYNTKEWCKNSFEIVNQLKLNNKNSFDRYDVLILINGIPMVHIELKKYDVSPEKALEQIVTYKKEHGSSLNNTIMCFTQLYIVSNGNISYYFANNNIKHLGIKENKENISVFMWADDKNKKINNLLYDFAPTFLEKCFLSEIIARFIVLKHTEQRLIVLRPYQIHAVKAILNHIRDCKDNGYIWHTTGSGKTLTSFKCATILRDNDNIDKVVFVVDRKDLDKQTIEEFNKFETGCVDQTRNTEALRQRMIDPSIKIIVTTLQKLNRLLSNPPSEIKKLKDKRIIFIFDECHRSQFGESNRLIRDSFNNIQMFGFTGTPIFDENAKKWKIEDKTRSKITTEDIFNSCLHKYLISDAIDDKNVLKFKIEYYLPTHSNSSNNEKSNKKSIVNKITLKHYDITLEKQFNAIFTVSSINDAIEYYNMFKDLQADTNTEEKNKLNIAAIFSPPPSVKTSIQEDLENEEEEYKKTSSTESENKKNALIKIIDDYNKKYNKSFSIDNFRDDTNNFTGYYNDISSRMKAHNDLRREHKVNETIDILIVVDMFLTGFDSKFISTMYADKNLEYHGLIQAYSRTNRIYNNNKEYGNIFNFRDLTSNVKEAVQLFSSKNTKDVSTFTCDISFNSEKNKLESLVYDMKTIFKNNDLEYSPSNIVNLEYKERNNFYDVFKNIIRTKNTIMTMLVTDDDGKDNAEIINSIIPKVEYGSFRAAYIETIKEPYKDKPDITPIDDEKEELGLDLFQTDIVDTEYIIRALASYYRMNEKNTLMKTKEEILDLIKSNVKSARKSYIYEEFIKAIENKSIKIENEEENDVVSIFRNFENTLEEKDFLAFAQTHDLHFEPLLKTRDEYLRLKKGKFNDTVMIDKMFKTDYTLFERRERRKKLLPDIEAIILKYHNEDDENE